MCLAALEARLIPGSRVVDLGSGSGVLSIAALRLGAACAVGVDIDPKAEDMARENGAYNGMSTPRFQAFTGDVAGDPRALAALMDAGGPFDLALINIVANVILALTPSPAPSPASWRRRDLLRYSGQPPGGGPGLSSGSRIPDTGNPQPSGMALPHRPAGGGSPMKVFSYHTKKMRLRKVLQVLGILALTGLVIWICWLVWLQRYVVYTREGVTFDFDRSTLDLDGKETGPQAAGETAPGEILFRLPPQEAQNLARLSGVYVDGKQLEAGLDQVSQKLSALESGTAVLLDVKSKSGQFYYTSRIQGAPQSEALDCAAMDKLIQTLKEQGCYLIARLPAFRDSAFAEAKPGSGLTVSSGALWTDEAQCHWLDPANQAVTANLIQICRELQERGFDEVVWTDFRIPDSGSIAYTAAASKDEILRQAARQLASCASQSFTVSFSDSGDFPLPTGQTRLYLENIAPEQAAGTAEACAVSDSSAQVVFLTASQDPCFDAYSVLRPLE